MDVDPLGLDDLDRRVLNTIIEKFGGGPVGLETIAASISEESDTIMDVVEPYLLQLGFWIAPRAGVQPPNMPMSICTFPTLRRSTGLM